MAEDDQHTGLRPAASGPAARASTWSVVAVDGPGKGAQSTFAGRILLGTSEGCDLRLQDSVVSRRHASLEVGEHGARLTDLGSTNGTFVSGVRVLEAWLVGGERLRVGDTTLEVRPSEGGSLPPPPLAARFGRVLGQSLAMRRLYPLFERLAKTDVPVVIEGETGTGKEQLAESLHEEGARASGPFVVFDCTAVPEPLFESALFGHEKGAFTGAVSARKGAFEAAHGGTLFIDEIGDLQAVHQPKLLRAIERSEVQRVGSERWTRVDVRVIAATRRDLDREVAEGRFRDDLYYRLGVARLELPPLRRRTGDVALLARWFWRDLGGGDRPFPDEMLSRWESSAWPGNVRELRNVVARHLALGEVRELLDVAELPAPDVPDAFMQEILARDLPLTRARQLVVEEFERLYVSRVLQRHGGNVRQAAASSGLGRRYFQILRARRR